MMLSPDAVGPAYPPVSQLPDEILCEIFIWTRLAQEGPSHPWKCPEKWDITWIRLSHVSRRWRTAALNESNLWTNPPLWNPTWTQIMLQRSKMATLPEILLEPLHMKGDVVASVLQHVARISNLTICRTNLDNLERILAILPSAAPTLKKLSINCRKRHPAFALNDNIILSVFPVEQRGHINLTHATGSVFSQVTGLRRLELSGILLNWNKALCSSVDSFTLCHIPFDLYPRHHLRSILEKMPNLTFLRLHDACPSSSPPQYTEIPLPLVHLEKIIVGPTIPQAIHLLEMVSTSSATLVHADLQQDVSLTNIRRLLAAMKCALPPMVIAKPTTIYERLSINDQHLTGVIHFGISKLCNTGHDLLDVCSDTLRLTFRLYDDDQANFLDSFLQSFDASLLVEVCLNIAPDKLTWGVLGARFMTTLSGIRSVVLSCYSASGFFDVLSSNTNPLASTTIILPTLQHICIVRCDLYHTLETTACHNAIDELPKLTMERRDRGAPLTSLRISGRFNLSKSYVSSLKDIVEHVIWDEAGADTDFPNYKPYEHI